MEQQRQPLKKNKYELLTSFLISFINMILDQYILGQQFKKNNNQFQKMEYNQLRSAKNIYRQGKTNVDILQGEKIVRKIIKLTNDNRLYAQYQIQLMKQISHPHVVKYINSEEQKDKVILYMKYYQNKDLQEFLQTNEVDFQRKIIMFIDILSGMMKLHSHFIIHRDIKLKNIFVDEDLRCVIGDLGIATKSIDTAKSHVGTFPLNAPQMYSRDSYNQKIDIWAIGIIAYQLFNKKREGKIPFPFYSPEQMRSAIIKHGNRIDHEQYLNQTKKIELIDESLPQEIRQMILSMLQNIPCKRICWVDFYKRGFLNKFDKDLRLSTFMAEYKLIEDTKQTLKEYLQYLKQQRAYYFPKLSYILSYENIQYFTEKYPQINENIFDIHVIHYKLMQKSLKRYKFLKQKKIFKVSMDWGAFIVQVKNEMRYIGHKINYKLINQNKQEINQNPQYTDTNYFEKTLKKIDIILNYIDLQIKK